MTPKQFDDRYQRGLALLNDPAYTIERFADYKLGFTVTNLSNKEIYFVVLGSRTCDCWDYLRNKTYCKHVAACEEILNQDSQLEQAAMYLREEANRE